MSERSLNEGHDTMESGATERSGPTSINGV